MPHVLNLNTYLARVDHAPVMEASLPVLHSLALCHAQSIPFENLDSYMGLPVSLDLADIERKLVRGGRGGYCFEHNMLFGQALRQIGFGVTDLAARVLWGHPDDARTAHTHMLLLVDLHGEGYVVDVGFGGQTLTGALRLRADDVQATPHGDFRLLGRDGQWLMQRRLGGEWRSLYRFDLSPQYLADYEVSNYYISTHPRSHFTQNLIAARPTPTSRLALLNRDYTVYPQRGEPVHRRMADRSEILRVLTHELGIAIPDSPALAERLDSLF